MYTVSGCIRHIQYSMCSKVCVSYNVQPRKQTPFCIIHYVCVMVYSTSLIQTYARYSMYSIVCPVRHYRKVRVVQSVGYTTSCKIQTGSVLPYGLLQHGVYKASTLWYSVAKYVKPDMYSTELRSIARTMQYGGDVIIQYSSCSMYSTVCKEQSDNAICKVCTVISCIRKV